MREKRRSQGARGAPGEGSRSAPASSGVAEGAPRPTARFGGLRAASGRPGRISGYRRRLWIAVGLLVLLAGAGLFGDQLAPTSPVAQDRDARFLPPGSPGFFLGSDEFGRDVFSRVIHGVRPALVVGLGAVGIAALVGATLGIIAGLSPRIVDSGLSVVFDALLSVPTVLLAVVIISVLGFGVTQVTVALGIVFVPLFARTARVEAFAASREPYYEASMLLAVSPLRRAAVHVLPNVLPSLAVLAATSLAICIGLEAALSYLGLGTQPPDPSWGIMLRDARGHLGRAPWLAVAPGAALALTVLTFNLLADLLAERLARRD